MIKLKKKEFTKNNSTIISVSGILDTKEIDLTKDYWINIYVNFDKDDSDKENDHDYILLLKENNLAQNQEGTYLSDAGKLSESLWKRENKTHDGKKIISLSGTLKTKNLSHDTKYYLNIYKNEKKKTEKSRDYVIYFNEVTGGDFVTISGDYKEDSFLGITENEIEVDF